MMYYKLALYASYYAVLIFSYMILVSLVGYFRALISTFMGDDTAKENGFLTINPAVHTDPFGIFLLIFIGIGWGRLIPVNPANIIGRHRWLKLSFVMLSGVIGYLMIALAGLVALVLASKNGLDPEASMGFSLSAVLNLFVSICLFLAAIELVVNLVLLAMLFVMEQYEDFVQYAYYAVLIVPILIFFIFGDQIHMLLARSITYLATFIAHLITRG